MAERKYDNEGPTLRVRLRYAEEKVAVLEGECDGLRRALDEARASLERAEEAAKRDAGVIASGWRKREELEAEVAHLRAENVRLLRAGEALGGAVGASLAAPIPKEDAPGCPYGECGNGMVCTGCRIDAEIAAAQPHPSGTAPAPAATGLPQECPGDEDDLPESDLCSACKGDGMQAHPGCSGCLACDGPCSTCGGTGRSPSPTGGEK